MSGETQDSSEGEVECLQCGQRGNVLDGCECSRNGPIGWETTHGDTVEVYRRHALKPSTEASVMGWGYRIRSRNGRVVEQGSEGYSRRRAAVAAAERHHPRVEP